MEWIDYATPDERKSLQRLTLTAKAAREAMKERRLIYDRCRKRMEKQNG